MILSRENIKNIKAVDLEKPDEALFDLPEKVLQFGTGVLLRGLPDYFIDQANRKGIFNGRVVVVKSTDAGSADAFFRQDSLYTLCIRGINNGKTIEENIISSAISRVLLAASEWPTVLQCAYNTDLNIIISNTTEVGIQLVKENIKQNPPASFPGKLLAFLYERFKAFDGSEESGMIIIPTELISDNGDKLKAIVLELAQFNQMESEVVEWIEKQCTFCNSLVDRIVPGMPDEITLRDLEQQLGYQDNLLTMAEIYRLWAIEGDEKVASVLSFNQIDEGVMITPDIKKFRELKLRLLNGTHTLSSGLAFLAGFETVCSAMDNATMAHYMQQLMLQEIAVAIPYPVEESTAQDFAYKVLDRFRNPHIQHLWINITAQYTAKLKLRVIPVLLQYYRLQNKIPTNIALGFAAWLTFIKKIQQEENKYLGAYQGKTYPIIDDQAAYIYQQYGELEEQNFIHTVLKDQTLWETDLTELPGFADAVQEQYNSIRAVGILDTIANTNTIK